MRFSDIYCESKNKSQFENYVHVFLSTVSNKTVGYDVYSRGYLVVGNKHEFEFLPCGMPGMCEILYPCHSTWMNMQSAPFYEKSAKFDLLAWASDMISYRWSSDEKRKRKKIKMKNSYNNYVVTVSHIYLFGRWSRATITRRRLSYRRLRWTTSEILPVAFW